VFEELIVPVDYDPERAINEKDNQRHQQRLDLQSVVVDFVALRADWVGVLHDEKLHLKGAQEDRGRERDHDRVV